MQRPIDGFSSDDGDVGVTPDPLNLSSTAVAIREREEQYRALAEVDPDGIVVVDDSSTILSVNPAMETIFGYSAEELVGEELTILMPESLRGAHLQGMSRYLESGKRGIPWKGVQVPGRRKDGSEVQLEINFGEYAIDGRHRFAGFIRDITERKRIEEALQAAKDEAERANLAKSEFLSRMSHELRTPLNGILGFGQVLERRGLPEDQRKSVEHILKAGRHLLALIDEVLDIARIEANRQQLSIEPVHLGTVLEEALTLIRPAAQQRSIRLPTDLSPSFDVHIQADRQRLMQVVLNLLSNAVKYNSPGGLVELIAERGAHSNAEGRLTFGVRDSGMGIPAERMDELFIPFSRLGAGEGGVEGTGLGLVLSKRLVEAMHGDLRVESTAGQGSTFWVELPVALHPLARLKVYRENAITTSPRKAIGTARRVLYLEDNLANLNLVESILEDRPEIRLIPALKGRLGLELAREQTPDLILLDLHLPDMSGEDVLRELALDPRTRAIPVLVISADATQRHMDRLRSAGVRGYLTKPIDVDEFLSEIDAALSVEP